MQSHALLTYSHIQSHIKCTYPPKSPISLSHAAILGWLSLSRSLRDKSTITATFYSFFGRMMVNLLSVFGKWFVYFKKLFDATQKWRIFVIVRKANRPIEMNITGMLPSDKLPIFFLKPNFTSRHACLEVRSRVFMTWLTDWALFACMKRLGMTTRIWLHISGWR